MKIPLSLLIFFLLVTKSYQKNPWDGFGLALIWPPGYCASIGDRCEESKVKSDFTIHGLWPFANSGAKLRPGRNSKTYQPIPKNSPLFNPLTANWPSIEKNKPDDGFWAHEWNDHGRASFTLFNQPQYFTKALDLLHRNNITRVLQNGGIARGRQYRDTQILDAIRRALNVNVKIQCKEKYLVEVRICFDQAAKAMINCNTKGIIGYCPKSFTFR
ncbi:PREDICTED: ribonuclease S-2-like isoform X2 [Ipomoea nil]|uniref:ribonuclease S-2-like isoform X2 n=1 Tax=Ipomoea nil TaxID=35883 RepID=UPI0009014DDC|nr:PREDICTED: ribonuclease S-2-like isoform X2 [Ipomoea nil]